MKIRKTADEKRDNDPDVLVCQDCGSTEDVSWQEDPYLADIHGDDSLYCICEKCARAHADDI